MQYGQDYSCQGFLTNTSFYTRLGCAQNFLGIQFAYWVGSLVRNQQKYAIDLL